MSLTTQSNIYSLKNALIKKINKIKLKSDYPTIHKACEKDNYLNAEEALKIGLIDEIV